MVNDGLENCWSGSERSGLFENLCRINTFPQYGAKDSDQVIRI